MKSEWIILATLYVLTHCEELVLLSTDSADLKKYRGYSDVEILHFEVPDDTSFVSFKFQAAVNSLTLFKCKPEDVTVYLKYGSPPVINPDGSTFPDGFFNFNRPQLYVVEFESNTEQNYINITSPLTGSYFAAAFISYTDPKLEPITRQGFPSLCLPSLNTLLYAKPKSVAHMIMPDINMHVSVNGSNRRHYKLYVPDVADLTVLNINGIKFCKNCTELLVKIQPHSIPGPNNTLHQIQLTKEEYKVKNVSICFMTIENCWYYIEFQFADSKNNNVANVSNGISGTGRFQFKVKYVSLHVNETHNDVMQENNLGLRKSALSDSVVPACFTIQGNDPVLVKHAISRNYGSRNTSNTVPYKQYSLLRSGYTESFRYSFEFLLGPDDTTSLLNITSQEMFVLKFVLNPVLDIGGTLQFTLAFTPRILGQKSVKYTLLACIQNNGKYIPTWPNLCIFNKDEDDVPIILNKTVDKKTVYLPYPEPGAWYMSIRLFCGECKPCKCSNNCIQRLRTCTKHRETHCENPAICDLVYECEQSLRKRIECANCDCEGPCQRSHTSCKTNVIFDIASYPCVSGDCGPNGECINMISKGLLYSTCDCINNYRGWNCSDDSQVNSYAIIILEFLLLVLSNVAYLPAVYIAYKREYYVEAVVYFSTFLFSIFYHACEIICNCIVSQKQLQFADIFSGLLSIWVTVIAMAYAYLPYTWTPICHMGGVILLVFGTTIGEMSLWVIIQPLVIGLLILTLSWLKCNIVTGSSFPSKRYTLFFLPAGIAAVGIVFVLFLRLQTKSNYKYMHSMWHIFTAAAIVLLLPNKSTFLPPTTDAELELELDPR